MYETNQEALGPKALYLISIDNAVTMKYIPLGLSKTDFLHRLDHKAKRYPMSLGFRMSEATPAADVKTRFLIFSDTHGLDSPPDFVSRQYADVAIHCGDLTTESQIEEYKASIRFLRAVNSPLKLVIAGNHDFTMDIPIFQRKATEAQPLDPHLIQKFYGNYGEVRELFGEEKETGITS